MFEAYIDKVSYVHMYNTNNNPYPAKVQSQPTNFSSPEREIKIIKYKIRHVVLLFEVSLFELLKMPVNSR